MRRTARLSDSSREAMAVSDVVELKSKWPKIRAGRTVAVYSLVQRRQEQPSCPEAGGRVLRVVPLLYSRRREAATSLM